MQKEFDGSYGLVKAFALKVSGKVIKAASATGNFSVGKVFFVDLVK